MRMSGIIFGGIVGAAAAMYITRNRRPIVFTSFSQAGQSIDKLITAAKDRVKDMGIQTKGITLQANPATARQNGADLDRVENLVRQDPTVKREVDEILRENGGTNSFPTQ